MKSKSLKDYIGTLPLTMEMFPEKQWTDDKGRQWTSNIKTSLEKNPKDNKWYLFPTMMGGLDLPFIGAYEGALKGKHFGVYDSKKEGMKADKAIHEYFDSIKGYQQGGAIEPDATKVHNNIDNLILEAELDKFAQTGAVYTDKTPEYIGGIDPFVANIGLPGGTRSLLDEALSKYGKKAHAQIRELINYDRAIAMDLPEKSHYLQRAISRMFRTVEPNKRKVQKLERLWEKEDWEEFVTPLAKNVQKHLSSEDPYKNIKGLITSPKTPKDLTGYQQGGTVESDATKVHNNIDNLILQAELDKLAQTGSMRVDRTPEYIGGLDPIVENVALSPILTLKGLGSVGKKILEKTGLRNPISHYTSGENMASILRSGAIKGSEWSGVGGGKRTVSLTRDPMFTSRGQGSIPTDARVVFDRDELIKKGIPTKPIAVFNYRKTLDPWRAELPKYKSSMNPRFEFEERVVGDIPIENAKLIDILRLPLGHSGYSYSLLNLLGQLSRTNIPIIKSPETNKRLKTIAKNIDIDAVKANAMGHLKDIISRGNREFGMSTTIDDIYRLIDKPTYKFDPFKEVTGLFK